MLSLWGVVLLVLGVGAIQVSIEKPEYEFARGDNITLPCRFTTKATDIKMAIVTWSVEGIQADAEETLVLTYYYPAKITDIKSKYEGRVSLDVDALKGKADLRLKTITLADNKVFECRVQIAGDDEGTLKDTARLVVLVAPSTPICKTQGKTEYGQNINLTCHSEEGSPPPEYSWESRDVRNLPRPKDPRTVPRGSTYSLFNISKETSGFFICTSKNKIRSATCNVTVAVMPPSYNIGPTAGIIAAVVAALVALVIIIYCCCCKKKKEEEKYAMGVRDGEYRDGEPDENGESRQPDRAEKADGSSEYEERSERGYDRRQDSDRRSDYDDRRSDYDDRRSDYTDRRSDYDNRRSDYDDRRDKYGDRRERYDDERRYDDDRRERDYANDRYDEPYDSRPPVPASKPPRDV